MNSNPSDRDRTRRADERFHALALRYLADDLTGNDAEELCDLLTELPTCCDELSALAFEARSIEVLLLSKLSSSPLAELQTTRREVRGLPFFGRRLTITPRLIGIAASISLVGYFVAMVGLLAWDRIRRVDDHERIAAQPLATEPALLADADDASWKTPAEAGAKDKAIPQTLQVRSGLAELQFARGALVILEGPAEFEVRSSKEGFLRRGKLVATVPQRASGFTVETPTVKVVDLGTEFGVDVDTAGRTDVEVITGKVDVDYKLSAKPTELRRSVRMTAGAARRFSSRVDDDGVAVTSIAPWVDKTAIARRLAKARPELPAETQYATAVLADHPLGYWRFSDGGKDTAADASGNGLFGEYHSFVSTTSPGIGASNNDRSVRFLGQAIPGWIEINNVELTPSLTIELWVRSATPEWNAFCWPLSSGYEPNGILIHPQQGARVVNFFVLDDQEGIYNAAEFAPENISDRLHHYVFAFDAERNRGWMYFDGQLVNERSDVLPRNYRRKSAKLMLDVGRQRGSLERVGEGWIDELAIYPRVLLADAVLRHYAAAEQQPTSDRSKE